MLVVTSLRTLGTMWAQRSLPGHGHGDFHQLPQHGSSCRVVDVAREPTRLLDVCTLRYRAYFEVSMSACLSAEISWSFVKAQTTGMRHSKFTHFEQCGD